MSVHLWIAIVFLVFTAIQIVSLSMIAFSKKESKLISPAIWVIVVFIGLIFLVSIGYLIYNIIGG